MTLTESSIPGLTLLHRGKVRETYAVGDDRLLLVATDRLSAFDVVFDQPIPDKGRLLTALSAFWFRQLDALGPTHFLSTDAAQLPAAARSPELAGRVTLARRAERIDAECVVRGYLAGSGWAEYRARAAVGGHRLPEGLREADRLPEPIFTPSTKAEVGHDENITREQWPRWSAPSWPASSRSARWPCIGRGAERAAEVGLILADTKFEFGWIDGRVALIDELLTPDSSRFWDAEPVRAGREPAVVRQAVRPRLRRRLGLGPRATGTAPAGRGDRGDAGALRDCL